MGMGADPHGQRRRRRSGPLLQVRRSRRTDQLRIPHARQREEAQRRNSGLLRRQHRCSDRRDERGDRRRRPDRRQRRSDRSQSESCADLVHRHQEDDDASATRRHARALRRQRWRRKLLGIGVRPRPDEHWSDRVQDDRRQRDRQVGRQPGRSELHASKRGPRVREPAVGHRRRGRRAERIGHVHRRGSRHAHLQPGRRRRQRRPDLQPGRDVHLRAGPELLRAGQLHVQGQRRHCRLDHGDIQHHGHPGQRSAERGRGCLHGRRGQHARRARAGRGSVERHRYRGRHAECDPRRRCRLWVARTRGGWRLHLRTEPGLLRHRYLHVPGE